MTLTITAVTTTPTLLPSVGAAFLLPAVAVVATPTPLLLLDADAVDLDCGNGVAATVQLLLPSAKYIWLPFKKLKVGTDSLLVLS